MGQTSGSGTIVKIVDDGLRCHDFCIEKLSDAEVERIAAAKKKLDDAQASYDEALRNVSANHGAIDGHSFAIDIHSYGTGGGCWPYDAVEIRGRYALITYHFQSCVFW